ncbi:MAG TPA: hypothetical protein VNL39_10955 [Xanthobacteraceae bacterium]|nr:hypothetical protein [Xanthobacteraceae bacterium]
MIALLGLLVLGHRVDAQTPPVAEIHIEFVSGGFIVGATAGSGTLIYQGKRYPLSVGGVRAGALIGLSKAELAGRVYNLNNVADIAGTYGAAEAGYAVVGGRRTAKLRNNKGVLLELRGRQTGLDFSLDLSGMVISLK